MIRAASAGVATAVLAVLAATSAANADIKIGTIYDQTGPFAAGGSKAASIGNKIAIDLINEKGGVEGHKIIAVEADAQSKTDVAINEAERLLNDIKVDLLMGVYSSAQCVPMAGKVDAAKKFLWANVCVASAVFKDKNLQYVFRPQVHSDQFGEASCMFLAENAKGKLKKRRQRTSRSPSSTRTAPTASASPWATKPSARSLAFRSCTRRATRRPPPTCRPSSPSCDARSPTSSCTPATIPTSRCSCASPRKPA